MAQRTNNRFSFLDNLAPSEDFGLNIFLGKLDESLTDEELEKLKFYCEGRHGIGKRNLEKIKRPLDLFSILKERDNLSNENLLTLQAMLWFLPRKDLQKECADFAKSRGKLHFIIPKDEPENGYKYVQFHVEGKNLDTFPRSELERLRYAVAQTILMIPPEFVIVRGIEPAQSLIITLMIPAEYVDHFVQMKDEDKQILLNISVNRTCVHGVEEQLSVESAKKSTKGSVDKEETRRKLQLLEKREKELETLRSKNFDYGTQVTDLLKQIKELQNPSSRITYLNALSHFRHALGKVKQKKYDPDEILILLDAHCLLIDERWKRQFDSRDRYMQFAINRLNIVNVALQYERDKLAYYHGLGKTDKIMSEREEYFVFSTLVHVTQSIIGINIEVTVECLNYVIKNLAKDLSKDEVKEILQRSNLSEKEKSDVGHSALKLLKMLVEQQNAKRGGINFNQFCIETLNRPDLFTNMERYVQEYQIKEQERQFRERSQPNTGGRKSSSVDKAPNVNVEAKLDEILERMNKMDERQQKFEQNMYHPSKQHTLFSQNPNENAWSNLIFRQKNYTQLC